MVRSLGHAGSLTYGLANGILGSRDSRYICNHTYLERRDFEVIVVKYYNTDIIMFHPNGDIIIDSGGYHTGSTRDRINAYLCSVCRICNNFTILHRNGIDYDYNDGILIDGKGKVHANLYTPPVVRYLESVCGIVTETKEEAFRVLTTLGNKELWKLWQRCTSLRSPIAKFCPTIFLPFTISSHEGRGQNWKDTVMARLDGKTYNINQELISL